MTIKILDAAHAHKLVAAGDITHESIRDVASAIMLKDAFEARLASLEGQRSCAAIDEGQFICGELSALRADWSDEPSPECMAHLY